MVTLYGTVYSTACALSAGEANKEQANAYGNDRDTQRLENRNHYL